MSYDQDPPRLRDLGSSASDEARSLLDAVHGDVPGDDQILRLARRLPLGLPPGSPGPSGGGGGGGPAPVPRPLPPLHPVAPAVGSLVPSAIIGGALGVAVISGAWVYDAVTVPPEPPRSVTVVAATASARAVTPIDQPRVARPDEPRRTPAPTASASVSGALPPVPVSAAPARSGSAATDVPAPSSGDAPSGGMGTSVAAPETEVELLQRAQRSLGSNPAAALAAAEEHRARFTGGALSQEREVIAISALAAMGRAAEARTRAARFLESYPRSAHRPSVEALVGTSEPR